MRALLETIARGLVERPDSVSVREVFVRDHTLLQVVVDDADRGKVVGKQGRTVRALDTYMRAVGRVRGRRVRVGAGRP